MKRVLAGASCALALACAGQAGAVTVFQQRNNNVILLENVPVSGGVPFAVDATHTGLLPGAKQWVALRLTDLPPAPQVFRVSASFLSRAGQVVQIDCVTASCEAFAGGPTITVVSRHQNLFATAASNGFGRITTVRFEAMKSGHPAAAAGLIYTAIPEPATWATMIAGFGLAGAGLRSRSRCRQPL